MELGGLNDGLIELETLTEGLVDGESEGLRDGLIDVDGLADGLTEGLIEVDGLVEGLTEGLIEVEGLADGETLTA